MTLNNPYFTVFEPASGVVKSTQRPGIWAELHPNSRESQNIGCSTPKNRLNVKGGRVCVASQTSEGQLASARLTRPRHNLRRLECPRASKLSLFSALPPSSQPVLRPSRLQNPSRLLLNPAWARCNCILTGSPPKGGLGLLALGTYYENQKSNWRYQCLPASKHLPFSALPFFSQPAPAQPKSQWKSRWSWKNHPWTRCNVLSGSALVADPTQPQRHGIARRAAPLPKIIADPAVSRRAHVWWKSC